MTELPAETAACFSAGTDYTACSITDPNGDTPDSFVTDVCDSSPACSAAYADLYSGSGANCGYPDFVDVTNICACQELQATALTACAITDPDADLTPTQLASICDTASSCSQAYVAMTTSAACTASTPVSLVFCGAPKRHPPLPQVAMPLIVPPGVTQVVKAAVASLPDVNKTSGAHSTSSTYNLAPRSTGGSNGAVTALLLDILHVIRILLAAALMLWSGPAFRSCRSCTRGGSC